MEVRRYYLGEMWDVLAELNRELEKIVPRYMYKEVTSIFGNKKLKWIRNKGNWDTYMGYNFLVELYDKKYEKDFIKVCKKYESYIEFLCIYDRR